MIYAAVSAVRADALFDPLINVLGSLIHLLDRLGIIGREFLVRRRHGIAVEHPVDRRAGRDLDLSRRRERLKL
jgi:hypothetical protein